MTPEIKEIWTSFHTELKAFTLNKTKSSADTDDILQEVFIKIMRNFNKVSQASNLKQYLYGIVRNSINDYFRSQQFDNKDNYIPENISEDEIHSLNATIANCCLKPFINKLPEIYREALIASELGNISQKELARKLNISYSGAKSRVQRGKEKLKELLLDCCSYQVDSYGNILEEKSNKCKNCS